jgi:hypothetical protein
VNAIAHHAAPATSLFEVLAAAEIPTAGAPAATGSLFHSMLQSATDAEDHAQAMSANQDSTGNNAPAVATPPQRAVAQSFTLNIFRSSRTPSTNEAKNAQPSSHPILMEAAPDLTAPRSAPPPIALNIFRPTYTPDKNEENASEALSTAPTNPAETVSVLPAQPSSPLPIALNLFAANYNPDKNAGENSPAPLMAQPAADAGISPKIKPAKKDSTADVVPAAVVAVPPQQTVTLPIALNIFPAGDAQGKDDPETTDAPSTKTNQPARGKVAEASTPPRTALSVAPQRAAEAQPDPDRPLSVDARAADASLSRLEPAFEMRLQPALQESLEPIATVASSSNPQISPPAKANMPGLAEAAAATAPETAPSVAPAASAS